MLKARDVKDYALKSGADIVGITSMDRWEGAPNQCDARFIAPDAKSMIVMGFRIPRGTLRGIEEGTFFVPYASMGYAAINFILQPMVCWKVTAMLEDAGHESVPIPNNFGWNNTDFNGQDPDAISQTNYAKSLPVAPGKPAPDVFLHARLAAFMAGLGEIGWSKMFLSPRFGPRQRLAFIITDAPLEPDPIHEGPTLCDRCMMCARECTGDAIPTDKSVKVTVAGHELEWADIDYDLCRPYFAGGSEEHNPFMVTEEDREGFQLPSGRSNSFKLPATYSYGRALEGASGCIRACMTHLEAQGKLDNKFETPFRRRKPWRIPWPRVIPAGRRG